MASAAAPTYFKPWTVTIGGQPTGLVDGGVGVTGNPVYQACVEAFYYDTFDPADTLVVSLGTGFFPRGNQWCSSAGFNGPLPRSWTPRKTSKQNSCGGPSRES